MMTEETRMMLVREATRISLTEGRDVRVVVAALAAAYDELSPANGAVVRYVEVNKALDRAAEAVDRLTTVPTPVTTDSLPAAKVSKSTVVSITGEKVMQRVRSAAVSGMHSKYDLLCVVIDHCPKDMDGLTARTETLLKFCGESSLVKVKDNVALGGLLTSCLKSGTVKRVGHGLYQLTDLGHEVAAVINK